MVALSPSSDDIAPAPLLPLRDGVKSATLSERLLSMLAASPCSAGIDADIVGATLAATAAVVATIALVLAQYRSLGAAVDAVDELAGVVVLLY